MGSNAELAEMFARMADVMQLVGENAFKAIAFQRVARVLEETGIDVVAAGKSGELPPMEGIGESSKRIIIDYAKTGRSNDYEQLIASVPSGVLQMLRIPGLGPKTVAMLWKERGVESVDALEQAIGQGKLAGLKGVGEKKIASMLDGIRLLKAGMQRRGFVEVAPLVEEMLEMLRGDKRVGQAEAAGSFRRRRETVGDVDLLCWVHKPADSQAVIDEFCTQKGVEKVNAQGRTKGSILVDEGFQIDLRIVPRANFGAALLYFTGSKDHNVKLRGMAQVKGMTLNEWGMYRLDQYDKAEKKPGEPPAANPVAASDEKSVYATLGLGYIEPELREDRGEIEAAVAHRLPRLVTQNDIRGELHCYTTASDGRASIEEMAEAAKALGYEYIAITDHSGSSVIANGLAPARLQSHITAIRKAQDRVKGIHILAGSEVDILVDGSLDYEDALLADLDLVIASPHVSLKQETQKGTDRLLRAIESRYVHIIGHPTGRMINQREGLPLDMPKIFAAAATTKTALEINSGWPRWDLNDLNARAAANAGAMISINTDAHAIEGLRDMAMGLWVARRAWLSAPQIVNCMPYIQLVAWLRAKR